MRNLDNIIRQIETTKRIQRPSDDPIIASRALMFRTSVHENEQFQRNVDQGMAWMNVTESTFNNINRELLMEMNTLAVQGANGDNNLDNMQAIIRQMNSLFNQLGYEMNQTFGGNYLFSGFRTDEPPIFIADNNRSFVMTQHFGLSDISREASFQRLIVPGGIGTYEPVSHNISVLKLAFTGLDADPVIPGFTVIRRSINDSDAYTPPALSGGQPAIHFIPETGELVMHRDTAETFPREGVSVTFQKTGFRQGDINPMVYFTGREIISTDTSHIPADTQLIYNVTQYFSRAVGTPVGDMYEFTLAHQPYANRNNSLDLRDSIEKMPPGAVINDAVTPPTVRIPASYFVTNNNISVTYAVEFDENTVGNIISPHSVTPIHLKEDIRVQGVELVRALSNNGLGVALPLDRIELNPSFDMHNQEIQYEFATRTRITVNSLAKDVLTDKMFADFRRFFEFSDSLHISNRSDLEQHFRSQGVSEAALAQTVDAQLAREGAMARDALFNQFNNMLFLISKHVDNSTREQTLLGARMVRMELVQNRLDEDEVSYMRLTSDNEDTDLIRATIMRFSAEAIFMASLRANSGVVQMSLANFLR
jgi:flagellin-like hook-associated protein FlgL